DQMLGRSCSSADRRPIMFFVRLITVSAAAYIPMAFAFDLVRWISVGPFFFQVSRILHYAVYFSAGIGVGAYGIERGLLALGGKLARRWPLWIVANVMFFVVAIVAFVVMVEAMTKGAVPPSLRLLVNFTFVLSCAASGFAFLSLLVRFAQARVRL